VARHRRRRVVEKPIEKSKGKLKQKEKFKLKFEADVNTQRARFAALFAFEPSCLETST